MRWDGYDVNEANQATRLNQEITWLTSFVLKYKLPVYRSMVLPAVSGGNDAMAVVVARRAD